MVGCRICARGLSAGVDSMIAAGCSERLIARSLRLHSSSIHRHKTRCLVAQEEREQLRREGWPPRAIVVYGHLDKQTGKFTPNARMSALEGFRAAAAELRSKLDPRDYKIAITTMLVLGTKLGLCDEEESDAKRLLGLAEPAIPTGTSAGTTATDGRSGDAAGAQGPGDGVEPGADD